MSAIERAYIPLKQQAFTEGEYSIVPIRDRDQYDIMKWRNEQIFHLRQNKPLTREGQKEYFYQVIAGLFTQSQPNQILFSFLKNDQLVGYGGLVHIAWLDKNAEVSFVMNTSHQDDCFGEYWVAYLRLLKKAAFKELGFRKIFTYAFDVRPHLYPSLLQAGFIEEARLKDHYHIDGEYRDVLIHSCFNPLLEMHMRPAQEHDAETLFDWANDPDVRGNAVNSEPILWEGHLKWFYSRLAQDSCKILVFSDVSGANLGQVRLDQVGDHWEIDYSLDKTFRGLGLGKQIISETLGKYPALRPLKAIVKTTNEASLRVFRSLGFEEKGEAEGYINFHKGHE